MLFMIGQGRMKHQIIHLRGIYSSELVHHYGVVRRYIYAGLRPISMKPAPCQTSVG